MFHSPEDRLFVIASRTDVQLGLDSQSYSSSKAAPTTTLEYLVGIAGKILPYNAFIREQFLHCMDSRICAVESPDEFV